MADYRFDTSHLEWREVREEPGLSYKLYYDYSVLGWDREAGTIDFVLRFYGGHSEKEIAELMNARPGTVKSLISRGLADLRKVIER